MKYGYREKSYFVIKLLGVDFNAKNKLNSNFNESYENVVIIFMKLIHYNTAFLFYYLFISQFSVCIKMLKVRYF